MRSPRCWCFRHSSFPISTRVQGTLASFALFSLAFFGRPLGTFLFTYIDQNHGRGVKLTIALFLLGGSTMAIALLPSHAQVGAASAWLLGLFRLLQGVALGGAWDGLPSLLALTASKEKRGWYSMIPQLGAPLGLALACALFAYFLALLETADFLRWGWRYPFFVALALNVVALFARLRIVATPEFKRLFDNRELQPSPPFETLFAEWRVILLGAFAPLASFALFHLVAVFPLSYNQLFTTESPVRFLIFEGIGALVCVVAILASGVLADKVGRRAVLGVSAALIGTFCFAPDPAQLRPVRRSALPAARLCPARPQLRPVGGRGECAASASNIATRARPSSPTRPGSSAPASPPLSRCG